MDNKHKGYKWDPSEWIITVDDNIISNDLNSFIRLMIKHYDEEIVPLYQNGFNYEAFFPDYTMSGTTDILAYIASAIIGVALLIIIFKILGSIIYAKKQSL
mgnify:CR=1 FL=1